jgi:hypothetical protein
MAQYHFGRSNRILKMKEFIEEDGRVVGVERGKGKDADLGILVIRDRLNIDTRIRCGRDEERRQWLINPGLVLGRIFTFKFTQRDRKTGRPFQPTVVGFRDYEIPDNFTPQQLQMIIEDTDHPDWDEEITLEF